MSPQSNASQCLDLLKANPIPMSMMAFSIVAAMCLDFADAVTFRDTLHAFPEKKV
jgi:hypothetical protein